MHPFEALAHAIDIIQVKLEISKNFEVVDEEGFLKSVDFRYSLEYSSNQGEEPDELIKTDCSAVLYAYDFKEGFFQPRFNFLVDAYEDYHKVSAAPKNEFFWENQVAFGMKALRNKNERFFKEASLTNQNKLFKRSSFFKRGIYEAPYIAWSKNRVIMNLDSLENRPEWDKYKSVMPRDRYNLVAQIYFDINQSEDSLHFVSQTIYDPFQTFYHFPLEAKAMAFINIYFDLVEMQRRALENDLQKLSDKEAMLAAYDYRMKLMEKEKEQFFREVDRGTKLDALRKWNRLVYQELGIDDMALFEL